MAESSTKIVLSHDGPLKPWIHQLKRKGRGTWAMLTDIHATDVAGLDADVRAFLGRTHLRRHRVSRKNPEITDRDLQDQWEYFQGQAVDYCFETISKDIQMDFGEEHQVTIAAMLARARELVSPVDNHVQTAMMRILHSPWTKGTMSAFIQDKVTARQRLLEAGGELTLQMLKIYLTDGVAGRKAYATKVDILRSQLSGMSLTEVKRQLQRFEQEVNNKPTDEAESDDTVDEEKSPTEVALLAKIDQLRQEVRAQNARQQESAQYTDADDSRSGRGRGNGRRRARGGKSGRGRGGGRRQGAGGGRHNDTCYTCGGRGHHAHECPSPTDNERAYHTEVAAANKKATKANTDAQTAANKKALLEWCDDMRSRTTKAVPQPATPGGGKMEQASLSEAALQAPHSGGGHGQLADAIVDSACTATIVPLGMKACIQEPRDVQDTVRFNKTESPITLRGKMSIAIKDTQGAEHSIQIPVAMCEDIKTPLLSESQLIESVLASGAQRAGVVKVATRQSGMQSHLIKGKHRFPLRQHKNLFWLEIRPEPPVTKEKAFVTTRSQRHQHPPAESKYSDEDEEEKHEQKEASEGETREAEKQEPGRGGQGSHESRESPDVLNTIKTTVAPSSDELEASLAIWHQPLLMAIESGDTHTTMELLHVALGHMSLGKLKTLVRQGTIILPAEMRKEALALKQLPCGACALATGTKKHTSNNPRRHLGVPEWVLDVTGPFRVATPRGERWCNMAVSPKGLVFPAMMKKKRHPEKVLKRNKAGYEVRANEPIKAARTDLGPEYVNARFKRTAARLKIHLRHTAPDSSAGPAENRIRYVQEKAKAMMEEAKAPPRFIGEAIYYAADCLNFQPSEGGDRDGLSCYEAAHGVKPPIHMLRRWGSKAYAHIPKTLRRKFGNRSRPAVFVGLARGGSEGYRLYCPRTQKFFHSRSVVFHEDVPGFAEENSDKPGRAWGIVKPPVVRIRGDAEDPVMDSFLPMIFTKEAEASGAGPPERRSRRQTKPAIYNPDEIEAVEALKKAGMIDQEGNPLQSSGTIGAFLSSVDTNPPLSTIFVAKIPTVPREEIPKGLRAMDVPVPRSPEEAYAGPFASFWAWALYDEECSHAANGSMEWAKKHSAEQEGKTVMPSMYVFSLKTDGEGNVVRFKVRWVAKGYRMVEGKDYDETFCPTPHWSSVLAVTNLALANNLEVHHADVKTAFLIPDLEPENQLFMEQPRGAPKRGKQWIFRLLKCIYGLKNSGKYWNDTVHRFLLANGFTPLHSDPCVYVHKEKGRINCVIAVFVDDFLIAGSTRDVNRAKQMMENEYEIKDLGLLSLFLGVRFKWKRYPNGRRRVELSQVQYVDEILSEFGMAECRPMSTPCVEPRPCSPDLPATQEEKKAMEGKDFRKMVGMLRFLSKKTRPEIEMATSVLARFQEDPRPSHWKAGMRIVAYLKGTRNYVLRFDTARGSRQLVGYTDSDHAPRGGQADKRKSTSGVVYTMHGGAIAWSSRKQSTTAKSSAEAELIAVASGTQEGVWLRYLLKELELLDKKRPTTMFCDNSAAVQIAKNRKLSRQTKHLEVDYFIVRQFVENKKLCIRKIASKYNLADIMTKPLGRKKFEQFRLALGVGIPSL
jgi:uncharacterized membrane protein YgcG